MIKLKVSIVDESCKEGESIQLFVPLDTDKKAILDAVDVLYPTCSSITIEAWEDDS